MQGWFPPVKYIFIQAPLGGCAVGYFCAHSWTRLSAAGYIHVKEIDKETLT